MKKVFKFRLTVITAVIACCSLLFGLMSLANSTVKANAITPSSFEMLGMSIRYSDAEGDDGIRFGVQLDLTTYNTLIEDNNAVAGILITPADKISGESLTLWTASASKARYGILYNGSEDVNEWTVKESYAEGIVYLHGFPEASYNRPITAVAYIDWNNDGVAATVNHSDTVNKSMADIALDVINDYSGANLYKTTSAQAAKLDNYIIEYSVDFLDENDNLIVDTQKLKFGEEFSFPNDYSVPSDSIFFGWLKNLNKKNSPVWSDTTIEISEEDCVVKKDVIYKASVERVVFRSSENAVIHTSQQLAYLADSYNSVATYANGTSEQSKPLPVIINSPSSENLNDRVIVLSEDINFTEFKTIDVVGEETEIYNLKTGTTYYYKLQGEYCGKIFSTEAQSFTTDAGLPRFIDCDGITNMRDLGGYTVADGTIRQGLVYRCARLNNSDTNTVHPIITETGIETMRYLGIKTEIDLRSTDYWDVEKKMNEVGGLTDASVIGDDINYYQCPMHLSSGLNSSVNYPSIKKVFEYLSERSNYPIIYHCTIGTDRTGFISYLLNGLLGVQKETLLRDYLFSNFGYIEESRSVNSIANLYVNMLDSQSGSTLSEKIENYLVNTVNVSESTIRRIKSILIDGYSYDYSGFTAENDAVSLYDGEIKSREGDYRIDSIGTVGAFMLDGAEVDAGESFMISVYLDYLNAENVGFVVGTLGDDNAKHVMFDWRNRGSLKDIYIWRYNPYGWKGVVDNDYPCDIEFGPAKLVLVYKANKYYFLINNKRVLEISEDQAFAGSSATIKSVIGSEGKVKTGLTASFGSAIFGDFVLTTDKSVICDYLAFTAAPVLSSDTGIYPNGTATGKTIKVNTNKPAAMLFDGVEFSQGQNFVVSVNVTSVDSNSIGFAVGTFDGPSTPDNRYHVLFQWSESKKLKVYREAGDGWDWTGEGVIDCSDLDLTYGDNTLTFVYKNGIYYMFIDGVKVMATTGTLTPSWGGNWSFLGTMLGEGSSSATIKFGGAVFNGSAKFSDIVYSTDSKEINVFVPDPNDDDYTPFIKIVP
ncbi:MAG: tyrosine-protein phosphatase [Clostridia bacterium]|nr:tyrosine-protein phosphatase [Clostridia bacterium]